MPGIYTLFMGVSSGLIFLDGFNGTRNGNIEQFHNDDLRFFTSRRLAYDTLFMGLSSGLCFFHSAAFGSVRRSGFNEDEFHTLYLHNT